MFDKADIFSDAFAHRDNLITGIEARSKITFVVIALGSDPVAGSVKAKQAKILLLVKGTR